MKMKKWSVWLLIAAMLLSCTGCGGAGTQPETDTKGTPAQEETAVAEQEPTVPQPAEETKQETEPVPEPEPEPESGKASVNYEVLYAPILDEVCELLNRDNEDFEDYSNGLMGIDEVRHYQEPAKMMEMVGYTLLDVDSDGVPELLIGQVTKEDDGPAIKGTLFSGFSCKDGKVENFLEGWGRNAYQWMGDGRFLNYGSSGAMYSMFGTYHMNAAGDDLDCEDFYFTYEKDESYTEIGMYHNKTGAWDKAQSEELDSSDDEFWDILEGYQEECELLELTPMAEYDYIPGAGRTDDGLVRVVWAGDILYTLENYEDVSDPDAGGERVVLLASDTVKDLKVLALTFVDAKENGIAVFDTEEVYGQEELTTERPLVVPMSFPGDIPTNGISYVDGNGVLKQFSIGISGKDGSLFISRINQ